MLFDRLKKQKQKDITGRALEEEYAPLEEKEETNAKDNDVSFSEYRKNTDGKSVSARMASTRKSSERHRAVELCGELVEGARALEDDKSQYQLLTSYLNDIQILEDLPEEEMNPIIDSAKQILLLDDKRNQYLQTEHRIPDFLYNLFQAEETETPGMIKRLKSNETYLDTVNKDLHMLEGEKVEWMMLLQEEQAAQKLLQRSSIVVLALFGCAVLALAILSFGFGIDTQFYMLLVAFFAVFYAAFAIFKYQSCTRMIRQCEVNRNKAITLENHVKIKYVNVKNAVDYIYNRYKVQNSYELTYQFEQYQEMVKEQKRFRDNSEDLVYYTERLVSQLEALNLYDSRIWLHYVNAIVNKNDMVELKHDLFKRRKKVRTQMVEQYKDIQNVKALIEGLVSGESEQMKQIRLILRKVDDMNLSRLQ
jgi:hypothetical protein